MDQRLKTIKLLERNIRKIFYDTGFDNEFQDMAPNAYAKKGKSQKLDFIKIKNFCAKNILKRVTRPTERGKK